MSDSTNTQVERIIYVNSIGSNFESLLLKQYIFCRYSLERMNKMTLNNYTEFYTKIWHKAAPETRGYVVCSMDEATHVVFTETDLNLAGDDERNFTPNHVYPIRKIDESGDNLIIDDQGQAIIGFDLFMPCEYLKVNNDNTLSSDLQYCSKVVSLSDLRKKRRRI